MKFPGFQRGFPEAQTVGFMEMGLSFLGLSFMSKHGGKGFCVAGLVRPGQEMTDSYLWVFGDTLCGGGENVGSMAGRVREKQENL